MPRRSCGANSGSQRPSRDGRGGFDVALTHVEKARAATAQIQDPTSGHRWLGCCERVEGEVLLRKGDAARAVPLLESALLKTFNIYNYRLLATALLDLLKPSATDAKARLTAMRITSLLDHAAKLDVDEEVKQQIADLRCRLATTAAGKAIAWTPSRDAAGGARRPAAATVGANLNQPSGRTRRRQLSPRAGLSDALRLQFTNWIQDLTAQSSA
jgi:hypothetical protein